MPPRKSLRSTIALVGRTNVGKSTLWNRLTETGRALTSREPHTTRDRNFGTVSWRGKQFDVIDTGGMDVEKNTIGTGIRMQAERAIREATLVLFIVDSKVGAVPDDRRLAKRIQELAKNVWLVANKVDTVSAMGLANDQSFYGLGLGPPHAISAATGLGIGELCDEITDLIGQTSAPAQEGETTEETPIRIALIGRPNVGKSSLVNAILGEERVIVSPVAHTTREPQDTRIRYRDQDIVLVDTAGMRRESHIKSGLEEAGIDRNRDAIRKCDVALLIFDATEDPTSQDRALAGMLEEEKKALILVANKWDLVGHKETNTTATYEGMIRQLFPFLNWAPMIFVSATLKQRVHKLLDMALDAYGERKRTIDYNALNRVLKSCIKAMRPLASYGPKSPRIYDAAQTGVEPPKFLITVIGEKENLHRNWIKFFEKRLREKFGFIGTPIDVRARHIPPAKSSKPRHVHGPGMEAVAGSADEKPRRVNQTRRRQKR